MDEKPTAAQPKSRRRWYQFGLRTLLIGVALLSLPCAYVAHEARIVASRRAWVKLHETQTYMTVVQCYEGIGQCYEGNVTDGPGPIRRWLGDEAHCTFTLVDPGSDDVQTARRLFPEANILEFHR